MPSRFFTNVSEPKFIDKLKKNIDTCSAFSFSVSFIKKAGLKLLVPNLENALKRGVKGRVITSTYQNFTDIDSLRWFYECSLRHPRNFFCHLDKNCFYDHAGNAVGFHSKGYIFDFPDHREALIGSSNITIYALLKNIEWDVSVSDASKGQAVDEIKGDFDSLWEKTLPLTAELIDSYRTQLYYAIERWDMDYEVPNADIKPNYMQRKALKELNRFRVMGCTKALVTAAAGSGKTLLAAFDVLNFNPRRLLYIVHEGSILRKSFETFQKIIGPEKSFGIYDKDFKEADRDFVFSTNITMSNSLEFFDRHAFDYCIIDECHHAAAQTYRKIMDHFDPQFLLGLTATPERMDGEDVFGLFDQNLPYELRLRDAIINGLVVPFRYYGIRDEAIEYGMKESNGHAFVEQFSDASHCEFIRSMVEAHRLEKTKLKALAFCRDIAHARRMAQAMEDAGYETQCLTGRNSVGERVRAYADLQDDNAKLEMLFTVDILNEGVDIPGVNMVLFLRPTDSQTIFIQQLGRGLRKYEGKQYVTVLDFIGNDYKRSVQIAFALGSLSQNCVMEKNLVAALVRDDFEKIGLKPYGVDIHIDDLSKKEILSFIDQVNFHQKAYLKKNYENFKAYINSQEYPRHVDYLNNDFAPDLIKFMQARIGGRKNFSYYGFLRAIEEKNLPSFDERQEKFVKYVSNMLPLVRPYEYLILQKLIFDGGRSAADEVIRYVGISIRKYSRKDFDHALLYMCRSSFLSADDGHIAFNDLSLSVDLDEYMRDLIEYGLGKYDVDYSSLDGTPATEDQLFHLWSHYRKDQVKLLLRKNPSDIMMGTYIYDDGVYVFVTVIKASALKAGLKYADGYVDGRTFQWETVANIKESELKKLKEAKKMFVFIRKVQDEDGIVLPFTYMGTGSMEYIEDSRKDNGAHLFRVSMDNEAPEDLYFDFKLPG